MPATKKFFERALFAIRRRIPIPAFLQDGLKGFSHTRSPVCLPWFKMRGKEDTINRIHQFAFEINRSKTRLAVVKNAIVWPLLSFILALYQIYCNGTWVKKSDGIGLWLQLKQIVYLANAHNLPPQYYYDFRLWNDSSRGRADQYIGWK